MFGKEANSGDGLTRAVAGASLFCLFALALFHAASEANSRSLGLEELVGNTSSSRYPVEIPFARNDRSQPAGDHVGGGQDYIVRLDFSSLRANGARSAFTVDGGPLAKLNALRLFDRSGAVDPDHAPRKSVSDENTVSTPAVASQPGRREANAPTFDSLGLMKVQFDLGGKTVPASGLSVHKPMIANGIACGDVELRIMSDTRILVNAISLSELLAENGFREMAAVRRAIGGSSFVDIDDIRAAGIEVGYDPVRDRLVLSG